MASISFCERKLFQIYLYSGQVLIICEESSLSSSHCSHLGKVNSLPSESKLIWHKLVMSYNQYEFQKKGLTSHTKCFIFPRWSFHILVNILPLCFYWSLTNLLFSTACNVEMSDVTNLTIVVYWCYILVYFAWNKGKGTKLGGCDSALLLNILCSPLYLILVGTKYFSFSQHLEGAKLDGANLLGAIRWHHRLVLIPNLSQSNIKEENYKKELYRNSIKSITSIDRLL